ncbi:TPA: alcohol dehydrogenase [bacterium]|nr:alcohol dehydrogenase [bacterium]
MKALLFDKELKFVDNYPTPKPGPDEALIKVRLAGICNTDLEITRGYRDFKGVLGHEFVGEVKECKQEDLIGKRVVGETNCSCAQCQYCQQGLRSHCLNRSVLGIRNRDGAFGEYLTLPIENLHPIPDEISDEEAVFVEPLAASCRILEQIQIRESDEVVVLGDGKLGLLVAQVISLNGCCLKVVGRYESKLEILKKRGIETFLVAGANDIKANIVIDCTGTTSGFEMATRMIKPMGKIVLKSTVAAKYHIDLSPLVVDEITLIGSRCGPFASAIRLLRNREVEVRSLISTAYPLEEGFTAFEEASAKGALKVLLSIGAPFNSI